MVSLCRELCPLSSAAAEHLSPPLSSISERVSIPRSAIRTALMERAAQDINQALEYEMRHKSYIYKLHNPELKLELGVLLYMC